MTSLVGPVLGPLTTIPERGSPAAPYVGDGADFAVGDLTFRLAVSDERPYERATAQFRKEQFDSSPTVGDQSLVGFWTRGQFSFHQGAGVTYYEVMDGETVLNRYTDSDGIEVGKPGKATLTPALDAVAGVAATKAVPGVLSGTDGVFALTSAGVKFWNGASATTMASSDAVVPTDIASDGRFYYACNGNKIERQSSTTLARTNHVTNPSFETNTTGWSDTTGTISRDTTLAKYGSACLKVTSNASGDAFPQTTVTGLTVGVAYKFSVWVYLTPTMTTAILGIAGTDVPAASTRDAWQNLTGYFTATATSHAFTGFSDGAASAVWYLDAVMVTESPYDGDYFDGSTPGGSWTSTAHGSKSTVSTSAAASSNVLWTHAQAGITWTGAWWAKGRLWAVDSGGRWYTLAVSTGGDVSEDDSFWRSGRLGDSWTLAEGASSVYIGNGPDVYSVAPDPSSGEVPTLSAPVGAATIPSNETISLLAYYLGFLIIASNAGVRVGATGNSGEVVYGPLVIEGDFSGANGVGTRDDRVYIVGVPEGRTVATLCTLDLGAAVSDLRPAWSTQQALGITTSTRSGVVHDSSGKQYAWADSALYGAGADKVASGYLQTGYHRFGTVEPKKFHTIRVRVDGEGGTVTVAKVLMDGSSVSLLTMDVAQTDGETITLRSSEPMEFMGLKFTLARSATDPTKGPTLLGYQLKAMPAPVRQRMIRVPLMLQDVERSKGTPAVGRVGSAWQRLEALEDMERSGASYVFQDFRTGEAGECFIEQVEHRGTTPPGPNNSGFGGVVWVTLRKL